MTMNPGERAVLRRAIADYMRAGKYRDWQIREDAKTRIADKLDIKPRRDGSYDFSKFATPREKE